MENSAWSHSLPSWMRRNTAPTSPTEPAAAAMLEVVVLGAGAVI